MSAMHQRPHPIRLAVVGLGRAGQLVLRAVGARPDIVVVAGVDPAPATLAVLPATVLRADSIDGIGELAVDVVVVATPTDTHVDVSLKAIDRLAPSLLLCEKPMATDNTGVERLLTAGRRAGTHVRPLLHYAFAPETLWLADRIGSMAPVVSTESHFVDAYADDLVQRQASLRSSWLDAGINALCVLDRLVSLVEVRGDQIDVTGAAVAVTFESVGCGGVGTIETSWTGTLERKTTRLVLASGSIVELDHRRGTAVIDGAVAFRAGGVPSEARYGTMLAAHLGDTSLIHDGPRIARLHRLLFEPLLAADVA